MEFHHDALKSVNELISPQSFKACLEAHGLYHSRQFVLRLSPINHNLIKSIRGKKTVKKNEIDNRSFQAYSTYIHENIHWWQHKGSISGFIRSMSYPAFSHSNMGMLKELASLSGLNKPLFGWWDDAQKKQMHSATRIEWLSNNIVNNFMDVEFYLAQAYNPETLRSIVRNNYFECQAHCNWIAYAHVLNDLKNNIDDQKLIFPDTKPWEEQFADCKDRKISGHYLGSDIYLPPLGMLDILEGQARFIQLHYLSLCKENFCIAEARSQGYLNKEYGRAFDFFINKTNSTEPKELNSPLVALFLLACDISINPSEGFIEQIENYEDFHKNTDPGYRFMMLCGAISKDLEHLKEYIQSHSKEEYISASTQLCDACDYMAPHRIFEEISSWEEKSQSIKKLMSEHATFNFGPPNPVTRILASELISFAKDKVSHPHFFCWPGAWMSGVDAENIYADLWTKNLALYSDEGANETIVPREMEGRSKESVNTAFNNFYAGIMGYDFIRQWIINSGEFNLEYKWLVSLDDRAEFKKEAAKMLIRQFGVDPNNFNLL